MATSRDLRQDIDIVGEDLKDLYRHELEQFLNVSVPDDDESDDPELPAALEQQEEQLTFSFRLDFLVATCRYGDSRPHERIGAKAAQPKYLLSTDEGSFNLENREQIMRALRYEGLCTMRFDDENIYEGHSVDTEPLNAMRKAKEKHNRRSLSKFTTVLAWDKKSSKSAEAQANDAAAQLAREVLLFHERNWLEVEHSTQEAFDKVRMKIGGFLQGDWPEESGERIKIAFKDNCARLQKEAADKQASLTDRAGPHLELPGMPPAFKAWCVTRSRVVTWKELLSQNYRQPEGYYANPSLLYRWFPATVYSPLLSSSAYPAALRRACGALRTRLRVHKPASALRGHVGVHVGSPRGWTLLQLKRFLTLWLAVEDAATLLHPEHASLPRVRATALGDRRLALRSRLGLYAAAPDPALEWYVPRRVSAARRADLAAHVPGTGRLARRHPELLRLLWGYVSVSALAEGLRDGQYRCRGSSGNDDDDDEDGVCVAVHARGWKRSGDRGEIEQQQTAHTVEVRLMAATLDAEHVAHWARVVEALARFARDAATPDAFREALARWQAWPRQTGPGALAGLAAVFGVPADTRAWFEANAGGRVMENDFFTYPDGDLVDWTNPWMAPGSGNVYGLPAYTFEEDEDGVGIVY
ncbi:hypothetical protein F4780DRAFT_786345 [Xylariomycetidae sp. FL0641]|nr:hypothetical protein F4780DRAFT_786345 [Xylariomycetidae sp. FL0641]